MNCRKLLLATSLIMVSASGARCPVDMTPPPAQLPAWNAAKYPWPMYGQNLRRTGQSPYNGPATARPIPSRNWTYSATGAAVLNMQPVVTDTGVYFGSWGVLRRDVSKTPDMWNKSDGRWYGLKLTSQVTAQGQALFTPIVPALNPAGYLFTGRSKLARDQFWVGANNDYLVSFYNGTIEGTPVIDPDDGTQYVGRGDGKLYAINPDTGAVKWSYRTFNPAVPDDPDGGGEIIGGPVLGPGKIIYFGTVAAPWPGSANDPAYETNALYAVKTDGTLLWRYPSATASLSNWLYTPPAISLDGNTLYVGTYAGDVSAVGQLLAIDLTQLASATDASRIKWTLDLANTAHTSHPNVYAKVLAVGLNGRIFVGGAEVQPLGISPAVFAVTDRGGSGALTWNPSFTEPQGYPSTTGQFCNGLAIREVGGALIQLYATTTHVRTSNAEFGGELFAIDPVTGIVRHRFDPSMLATPVVGGMTPPILGADGTIFVGVRGRNPTASVAAVDGHMFAMRYDTSAGFTVVWDFVVDGQIDWAAPVIGANGALYFGTSAEFQPTTQIQWFGLTEMPTDRSPKFYGIFE